MAKRPSKRDLLVSACLLVGFSALYFVQRQDARWSDGRALVALVESGRWAYHHFLYLPAARVFAAVLAPVGVGSEPALQLFSAVAAALAVALFHLAARASGFGPTTSLLGALLLASAPVVWFFGTCVEVHAFQLAFAAGAVLWAARVREVERPSAVPPALLLGGLFGAHMTGALWAPALLLVLVRGRSGWRRPRHVLVALGVGAGTAAGWLAATGGTGTGSGHVLLGLRELLQGWRVDLLWREVLAPGGLVYPLALLGLLAGRARLRSAGAPLLAAIALLFLSLLPFAFTLHIAERGAYFISLVPVAVVAACLGLDALGRWRVLVGLLVVAGQVAWSVREVHEWEHHYPGWEWAGPLFDETGEKGLVLAYDRAEWEAVSCHSEMTAISLKARRTKENFGTMQKAAFRAVERALAAGEPVAITRSLFESDVPEVHAFVVGLVGRFGTPVPGRRPEYLFFPGKKGEDDAR